MAEEKSWTLHMEGKGTTVKTEDYTGTLTGVFTALTALLQDAYRHNDRPLTSTNTFLHELVDTVMEGEQEGNDA